MGLIICLEGKWFTTAAELQIVPSAFPFLPHPPPSPFCPLRQLVIGFSSYRNNKQGQAPLTDEMDLCEGLRQSNKQNFMWKIQQRFKICFDLQKHTCIKKQNKTHEIKCQAQKYACINKIKPNFWHSNSLPTWDALGSVFHKERKKKSYLPAQNSMLTFHLRPCLSESENQPQDALLKNKLLL